MARDKSRDWQLLQDNKSSLHAGDSRTNPSCCKIGYKIGDEILVPAVGLCQSATHMDLVFKVGTGPDGAAQQMSCADLG